MRSLMTVFTIAALLLQLTPVRAQGSDQEHLYAVLINGGRDRRRPRFARVPTGNETCDFCLMLASRGFVYRSADSATHTHANCDCRIVPSWDSNEVEGYDPSAIYGRWQEQVDEMARERAERRGTSFEEERGEIMARYARAASNARQRRR